MMWMRRLKAMDKDARGCGRGCWMMSMGMLDDVDANAVGCE